MSESSGSDNDQESTKLDKILKELISFKKYTKSKFEEIKENNKKIIANLEDLRKENHCLKLEIQKQKTIIANQGEKIEFIEKALLDTTVSIHKIPKLPNEDIYNIFCSIASKLGVKLTTSSVIKIYRKKEKGNNVPGVIIVKCGTESIKNALIKEGKKNKLSLQDIGFSGNDEPFYINQELTQERKTILYETRKLQKRYGWKYVWEKGGDIFLRKVEGGEAIKITSTSHLLVTIRYCK